MHFPDKHSLSSQAWLIWALDYSDRIGAFEIAVQVEGLAGPKEIFLLGRVHFIHYYHEAKLGLNNE